MKQVSLYRAMCKEEAERTMNSQQPQFIRRYKWFSPKMEFVKDRVQDNRFNNSNFKPGRYSRILMFSIDPSSQEYFTIQNAKEWRLDIRRASLVKFIKINEMEEGKWHL